MSARIALLRGINVGGRNRIAMADLRTLFESLGFVDVKTLLQSGNVVFRGDRRSNQALERLLEVETASQLNVSADYVLRTTQELDAVIAGNPFPDEATSDPSHLVVLFPKDDATEKNVSALRAAIKGNEVVRGGGKQIYIHYQDGIGRSKLTNDLIERRLGSRGTGRNWNTVLKLAELAKN